MRHSWRSENRLPFDLHVLGTPPAFILSQDQTLRRYCLLLKAKHKARPQSLSWVGTTVFAKAKSVARTSLSLLHLLRYTSQLIHRDLQLDLETKPPTFTVGGGWQDSAKTAPVNQSLATHLPTLASVSQIPFAQRPNHYNASLTKTQGLFRANSQKLV